MKSTAKRSWGPWWGHRAAPSVFEIFGAGAVERGKSWPRSAVAAPQSLQLLPFPFQFGGSGLELDSLGGGRWVHLSIQKPPRRRAQRQQEGSPHSTPQSHQESPSTLGSTLSLGEVVAKLSFRMDTGQGREVTLPSHFCLGSDLTNERLTQLSPKSRGLPSCSSGP